MDFFRIDTDPDGVSVVTFSRPPVNAVSYQVYREIGEWSDRLSEDERTRVVVLAADPDSRAWCGGADVHEFLELDHDARLRRYEVIHETLPHLYRLKRPVIAAIDRPAVGVGIVLASFCDIRIAAEEAFFAAPEIDRGVLAALGPLSRLGVPTGLINEMVYTGRRFTAGELRHSGLFNHVLPAAEVLPKAIELARAIASKSLPALIANKHWAIEAEGMSWEDAYTATHEASAELTSGPDSKEGIRAFLERRRPEYLDR